MSVAAAFLDRDGVLNRAIVRDGRPYPPATLAQFEILPGVADALTALKSAGYRLVVVTNQPDVARGTTPLSHVEAIHAALLAALPIDAIRCCLHDSADGCVCRKPLPGLLRMAAGELGIDLGASWMIGDRWRDIEAGRAAGCRTIFIDYDYREERPNRPDHCVDSLAQAARIILGEHA